MAVMFPLHPPGDPYFINTTIFGIPLVVRWYGVIIVGGAMLAGRIAAGRAERRGYDPEHIWNMLLITLACGIAAARAYYVIFEWERFAGRPWLEIINPANGGIAIHGALIGSVTSGVIYTIWHKLPTLEFVDITMPTILVGQAIGRWGNFMNQEAYGRPTTLPFGVTIDADRRLPPYNDMASYPPTTLFTRPFCMSRSGTSPASACCCGSKKDCVVGAGPVISGCSTRSTTASAACGSRDCALIACAPMASAALAILLCAPHRWSACC